MNCPTLSFIAPTGTTGLFDLETDSTEQQNQVHSQFHAHPLRRVDEVLTRYLMDSVLK